MIHSAGLSNQLLSVELAVGMAKSLKRDLCFINAGKIPSNGMWGDNKLNKNEASILDLFDLPLKYEIDCETTGSNYHWKHDLINTVFCLSEQYDEELLKKFRPQEHVIFKDEWATNLILTKGNLGFYSRFFFGDTGKLFKFISKIKPKKEYLKLATKISKELGKYNAVHMRLGDWTQFMWRSNPNNITDNSRIYNLHNKFMTSNIPEHGTGRVVISTNTNDIKLFDGIRKDFPRTIILEEHIKKNYVKELNELPFCDDSSLALLCILVCSLADDFFGCCGSTFTGIIQRYRFKNNPDANIKYHDIDIINSSTLKSDRWCNLLEYEEGPYSWNRFSSSNTPTWFFEYLESVMYTNIKKEKLV